MRVTSDPLSAPLYLVLCVLPDIAELHIASARAYTIETDQYGKLLPEGAQRLRWLLDGGDGTFLDTIAPRFQRSPYVLGWILNEGQLRSGQLIALS